MDTDLTTPGVVDVEALAVGVANFQDRFNASVGENANKLVLLFIADVEECSALIPDGTFRESESAGDFLEFGVGIDELPEFWRFGFELELPGRGILRLKCGCEEDCNSQRESHVGD